MHIRHRSLPPWLPSGASKNSMRSVSKWDGNPECCKGQWRRAAGDPGPLSSSTDAGGIVEITLGGVDETGTLAPPPPPPSSLSIPAQINVAVRRGRDRPDAGDAPLC